MLELRPETVGLALLSYNPDKFDGSRCLISQLPQSLDSSATCEGRTTSSSDKDDLVEGREIRYGAIRSIN